MRYLVLTSLVLALGCDAAFTDLRPDVGSAAGDTGSPNNRADDVGSPNNDTPDMGSTTDDGTMSDTNTPDDMAVSQDVPEPMDTIVASGAFVPRANYGGEGTAELVELADGSWELRIGADFMVGTVPGPVVVLAREDSLGSTLDPGRGDMELGVLETNSGASTYALPAPPEDRRIVWIYCKPFGLQMTSAQLEDQ